MSAPETPEERHNRYRDGGRTKVICRPSAAIARRSCYNADGSPKVRWPNPTSAEFVIELAAFRRRKRGLPPKHQEAYYCGFCSGWHVGKPPRLQWFHTMPERHPELMVELGVRAVAVMWSQQPPRADERRLSRRGAA